MAGKKKKSKLRVAFRKNRQKRARRKDFGCEIDHENGDAEDLVVSERLSGKGDLTRHRTVIGLVGDSENELLLDVDEARCLRGRVISATGLHSIVQAEDGTRYECTTRRVLRTMIRESRNAVVAGDRVLFNSLGQDVEKDKQLGVIERVDPRSSTLSRVSRGREHVIVANVDQVLIVASAADPPLKPNLIDRFLISAEKGGLRSILCINKCDLVGLTALQPIAGLYGRLGYEVVLTSVAESIGFSRLRTLLQGEQTVLAGQSGVGKSSLLNALLPGLDLRVAEVAGSSRKGRHTTRSARLLPLDFGGWVVDTPGLRQFALWDVIPAEVEGFFVEFRPFVTRCRFPDCSHTHEQCCGVKLAVYSGLIASARYESYLRIFADDDSHFSSPALPLTPPLYPYPSDPNNL